MKLYNKKIKIIKNNEVINKLILKIKNRIKYLKKLDIGNIDISEIKKKFKFCKLKNEEQLYIDFLNKVSVIKIIHERKECNKKYYNKNKSEIINKKLAKYNNNLIKKKKLSLNLEWDVENPCNM